MREGGREERRETNRGAELGETLVFFLLLLYAVSPAKKVCPYELHLFQITERLWLGVLPSHNRGGGDKEIF